MTNAKDIFNKLSQAERSVFSGEVEFLAPVIPPKRNEVVASIENIDCKFSFNTTRQPGWYVFKAKDAFSAKIVREASSEEIEQYQKILPAKKAILVHQDENSWLALIRGGGEDLVRVWFVQGVERFDYAEIITDGSSYYFKSQHDRRDPFLLEELRTEFREEKKKTAIKGLETLEKKAFAIASVIRDQNKKSETERRIESALSHANAKLRSYRETGDMVIVEWEFDGHRRSSTVRKSDMTVVTAGICLSGTDTRYDLASLPSVFREKLRRHGGFHNV